MSTRAWLLCGLLGGVACIHQAPGDGDDVRQGPDAAVDRPTNAPDASLSTEDVATVDASAATDTAGSTADAAASTDAPTTADDVAPASDAAPLPASIPLDVVTAAKPVLFAAMTGHIEGPSWRDGQVFFSVVDKALYRADESGKVFRYLDLTSNGSFLLADGSLLVCDDKRAMVQVFPDGKVGVLGDSNAKCNDVTVDAWGNIYFSDFIGTVYRLTPEGVQTKAITTLHQPNGVEVDPKSEFLYVLPRPSDIYRVAITKDGPTGIPEKLGQLDGVTDGCVFDAWGNLWAAVYYAGKVNIFDPVKKQVLAQLDAGGGGLTNMTFGGPNRDVLFTTIDNHGIYRLPVGVPGFRGHPGAAKYTIKSMLDLPVVNAAGP